MKFYFFKNVFEKAVLGGIPRRKQVLTSGFPC